MERIDSLFGWLSCYQRIQTRRPLHCRKVSWMFNIKSDFHIVRKSGLIIYHSFITIFIVGSTSDFLRFIVLIFYLHCCLYYSWFTFDIRIAAAQTASDVCVLLLIQGSPLKPWKTLRSWGLLPLPLSMLYRLTSMASVRVSGTNLNLVICFILIYCY